MLPTIIVRECDHQIHYLPVHAAAHMEVHLITKLFTNYILGNFLRISLLQAINFWGVNEGNVIIISVYGHTHCMINIRIDNSGTLQLSYFFLETVKYCYRHNAMYDIS